MAEQPDFNAHLDNERTTSDRGVRRPTQWSGIASGDDVHALIHLATILINDRLRTA